MAEPQAAVELEIKPSLEANMRVAALIGASAGVVAVLMFLITGGGAVLFASHTTLITYVPDAAGVGKGSEVRLSGIPIGAVSEVDMSGLVDPQRVVRIAMKVDARYLANIPRDSQTVIGSDSLVGDQFVSIEEGKSPLPVPEGATLPSEPVKQTADQANLMKALRDELQQVDDLLTAVSSPDTPMGKALLGSEEYDQGLQRIRSFDQALHALAGPESKLAPALFSSKLYDRIAGFVQGVDQTLASVQKGEGAAGRLFASDAQYDDFLKQLRDLRKSLAEASANPMLRDDTSYGNIRDLLTRTDASIAAMSSNRLMTDRKLYDSLNASLQSVRKLLEDLRLHPEKYLRLKL